MYETFFGFKERPFQLVPNPAYLYLSRSHEEALAHLTYAVRQGDGFVEITGEVGTGKTTLCRVFLENLEEAVEAAYIFNPMLTPRELLTAIRDELGVETPPGADVKTLIDALNTYLMERRRAGRRVILLIDEAQNLSRDVLEQLRLLSNLETRTHKLIQIILVGQPELRDLLGSYELRQLGQRITLSCHLTPFNLRETVDYIRHRIQIASRKPGVRFTRGAFRAIHSFSGGVPRLVNMACDRALLTAYGMNRRKINRNVARTAIRELTARGSRRIEPPPRFRFGTAVLLGLLLVAGVVAAAVYLEPWPVRLSFSNPPGDTEPRAVPAPAADAVVPATESPDPATAPEPGPETKETTEPPPAAAPESPPEIADAPPPEAPPATEATPSLPTEAAETSSRSAPKPVSAPLVSDPGPLIAGLDPIDSRRDALLAVLRQWKADAGLFDFLDAIPSDADFFRIAARRHSMDFLTVSDGLALLRKLNLPAVLELYPPERAEPVFLALTGLTAESVTLTGGSGPVRVPPPALAPFWRGEAMVPWRNFYGVAGIIPRSAPDDAIITLKMMLRDIGFVDLEATAVFDAKTRQAVEYLQEKHDVVVDGMVGPQTKIILYNELADALSIPTLRGGGRPAASAEREGRPL
jgi:general secretion pathway protein A